MSTIDPVAYGKQLAADVHRDLNAMHNAGADQGQVRLPENVAGIAPTPEKPEPGVPPESEELIFGKYRTLEEARKGYFSLLNHTTSTLDENRRLKEQLANGTQPKAEPQPARPGASPRVNPAQMQPTIDWTREDAVAKLADRTGIDTADLAYFAQALHEQAAATAKQVAEAQLAPLQQQTQAQNLFNARHPDAARLQPELSAFADQMDPVQQGIAQSLWSAGDVLGTMEYIWDQFNRKAAVEAGAQLQGTLQATEAQRVAARQQAGMLQSSHSTPIHAADPRSQPASQPTDEDMVELGRRYRAGDHDSGTEWRRRAFGDMLPPHMRTWEQR